MSQFSFFLFCIFTDCIVFCQIEAEKKIKEDVRQNEHQATQQKQQQQQQLQQHQRLQQLFVHQQLQLQMLQRTPGHPPQHFPTNSTPNIGNSNIPVNNVGINNSLNIVSNSPISNVVSGNGSGSGSGGHKRETAPSPPAFHVSGPGSAPPIIQVRKTYCHQLFSVSVVLEGISTSSDVIAV